ncbi:hypothetical protein NONO_c02330 [Nocardia nova SH22a]|uniref:Diacylglycerol O-acyltransferase n=1 Tax=Nocardia nova SH22a TaxID=1415166 RepID=W5T7D1_9NOCA|nr:hypothetical protein [Nocardia nova]AHH15049.1 hypothetical protein NONO_c02330 [Nocardia nova SH22a]
MDCLTPQDATRFWLSRRACNDLFLLYCFDDTGCADERLRSAVIARSSRIPDLRLRIHEYRFAYPAWEPCDFDDSQFIVHSLGEPLWTNVEAALDALLGEGLPAERYVWRLHILRGIRDAPGGEGPAVVVVLQLSHALADGRRAAAIARELLSGLGETGRGTVVDGPRSVRAGTDAARDEVIRPDGDRLELRSSARDESVSNGELDRAALSTHVARASGGGANLGGVRIGDIRQVEWKRLCHNMLRTLTAEVPALLSLPLDLVRTVARGFAAARAESELARLSDTGDIPGAARDFAPSLVNLGPAPTHRAVRMIVGEDLRVPGYTVTVVALTAISVALGDYLTGRGAPAADLGAQVSVAGTPDDPEKSRKAHPRNNYRDISVDFDIAEPDLRLRADRIARTLVERRTRATHPLQSARGRVSEALPAPILRRDLANFPLDLVPDRISGHTVLSSVHRGRADLSIAGGAVRFTAGFPALGSVMHLTHGLHGLGSGVTVSIHTDPQVLPDVDEYARLLRTALREVADQLRD